MKHKLNKIVEEWLPKEYKEHICRFNDGECKCECYNQALQDLRTKAPQIAQKILTLVVVEIWKKSNEAGMDYQSTINFINLLKK